MAELAPPEAFNQATEQIGKLTAVHLLPLWMGNWASNLQLARLGDSLDKLYSRPASERVLVVGRGPSIKKQDHLELLARRPFPGHVVASDGGLPLLLERRIVPYLSMSVDGSPLIQKWFADPATKKYGSKVGGAVLPVTVHPKTVAACQEAGVHIYWYIPELDQEPTKGLTDALQLQTVSKVNPTGLSRLNGAGNCGLAAMVLALQILRAKEIVLIGMDSGYPPDTPLSECHYHEGMMRACGYKPSEVLKLYRMYQHPVLKYTVVDPAFEFYRRIALTIAGAAKANGVRLVNATEGGCLFGDGIEVMGLEAYLRR